MVHVHALRHGRHQEQSAPALTQEIGRAGIDVRKSGSLIEHVEHRRAARPVEAHLGVAECMANDVADQLARDEFGGGVPGCSRRFFEGIRP